MIIAGATATGKTRVAVSLAERIGGEVISADSMQVYKYMDIGTAKPSPEEMRGIDHYLIDEIYPDEEYSAAIFQRKAKEYIRLIREKGKTPIICGGTGFYINSILYDNEFASTETDSRYREELYGLAETRGNGVLHGMLEQADPESAALIHENNVRRTVRALEYYAQTGERISAANIREKQRQPVRNALLFILDMERDRLYRRIGGRVGRMVEKGLISEVENLLGMGYNKELVSMQGLGYKEATAYLSGECTLDEAAERIKLGTRRYAKRQLTWFRGQCSGVWLDAPDGEDCNETTNKILGMIENVEQGN